MKIPLVVIAAALLLGGCASMKSSAAGYQARLESLRGVHIDEVVLAWGPPDGEFTFEDGRRMYAFVTSRLVTAPRMTPGFVGLGRFYGRRFYDDGWPPMETRRYFCETRLITDKEGRIMDWNFRGNACRAIPPELEEAGKESKYRNPTLSVFTAKTTLANPSFQRKLESIASGL